MEIAQVVAKKLMMEIIPRFGHTISLWSDNGTAFRVKLSQLFSETLNLNWKLPCVCHPQSLGKVGRVNRTLEIATTYALETGGDRTDLLPCALLPV